MPQPEWFKDVNVEKQDGVAGSTLELYRTALMLRKGLVCAEKLNWNKHWFNSNVLDFTRPNGWRSVTNFGNKPIKLPKGKVLLSSGPINANSIPGNTTVWLQS